ncbi:MULTISPECIES: CPBP family intramembrane glutamic endopeptidase [Phenylobacterium]|uniref:Membrane protease YdiL (CAAX protease family) n=1 Tax=Phenylobacterium koreense TaxID=266125 RepID=A0ABV2EHJ3_9CAUL
MITHFPFLQTVTERDRRWPRLIAMAAAMPLAVVVLTVAFIIVLGTMTDGRIFEGVQGAPLERSADYVLQLGAGLGAMALAVMLVARYVFARPIGTWLTAAPHFRWSLMFWGAGATAVGLSVLMALDAVLIHNTEYQFPILDPTASLGLKFAYVGAVLIGLLVAATAEEAVFRGYVLQQTAAFTRNTWILIGVNAVVFALAHLEFDPAALVARALAGAVFAWAALRLGGLEFAIGAHVATNLMIALLQAPMLPEDPPAAGGLEDMVNEVLLAFYMVCLVEQTRKMPRLMGAISSPASTGLPSSDGP